MKQKIRFIINPKSGKQQQSKVPRLIERIIDENRFDYDVVYTEHAGHGHQLAKQAIKDKVHVVCAVGGDGSVHDIGTALIKTEVALAILPMGSGNGLARHFGLPIEPELALQRINRGAYAKVDTVKCNNSYFLNACGFGFDAVIAQKFAGYSKRGFWGYTRLITKEYFRFTPQEFSIQMKNNAINERLVLCSIANGSEFGNGLCIAPQAKIDDGKIELCLMRPFPAIHIPGALFNFFTRQIHNDPYCEIYQAEKFVIEQHYETAHLDGEPKKMSKKVEIEVDPLSLKVLI